MFVTYSFIDKMLIWKLALSPSSFKCVTATTQTATSSKLSLKLSLRSSKTVTFLNDPSHHVVNGMTSPSDDCSETSNGQDLTLCVGYTLTARCHPLSYGSWWKWLHQVLLPLLRVKTFPSSLMLRKCIDPCKSKLCCRTKSAQYFWTRNINNGVGCRVRSCFQNSHYKVKFCFSVFS